MPLFAVQPVEWDAKSATSIHANAKISVKDREHALIAGANDIDHDIAAELSSQVQNQIDISIDEKNALAKYWLKTVYNVQWEITPKFVATYRNPKMMKIYKNLCKMTNLAIIPPDWSGTPLDYALKSLQAEERGMHGYLMTNNRSDDDINKNYMFTQHYTAISLLKILGWNDIFDGGYIGKNAVTYRVREASLREASLREASLREASLQKFVDNGSIEFNIRKPRLDSSDENNVTSIVKFTSQILTLMYGIKIVTSGDLFRIVRPTEFTDSYEEAMLKHIPCYGRTSADVPIEISACIDDDAEIVIIDDL